MRGNLTGEPRVPYWVLIPLLSLLLPHRPHLLENDLKYLLFIKCVITVIYTEPQEHCTEAWGHVPGRGNSGPLIFSDSWVAIPSSSPHIQPNRRLSRLDLLLLLKNEKKNEYFASKYMSFVGFQGTGNDMGQHGRHHQVV